jgi:PAS domain S-box-containing protein
MTGTVRVVLLEDVQDDAELIRRQLIKANPLVEVRWVQTELQYNEALGDFDPDIVISDHSLPSFSSEKAFQALKQSGLDIPFILVTATMSEEFAVMMMREGIADYLLKDRLQRLPVAVTNALQKWQTEREKRRSRELLEQSERRFRGMIENSHDMIGVTGDDFKPFYVSASYMKITGRGLQEGRDGSLDFIHPDDRREYYATLNKAKATPGEYFGLVYRMLHKHGYYISVEGTVINMLNDAAINGIIFNLRDVTLRKEAEESLVKSQAHMAAILENSNVSIYSIDRQFRYIAFNSHLKNTLKQVYGLDIKVGDLVFDFIKVFDPVELPQWEKVYTEAFSGNRVEFEREFKVDEHYACLSFSVNPIVEGHYVTGLSCFAWDITNQKLAAKKLIQSEARFRALIENNYDAIVMRDENQRVIYSSPSVKRMLGYSPDDIFDVAYGDLIHPDDVELMAQVYKKLVKEPNVPFPLTIRIKRKNGTYLWSEGLITNLLDTDVKGIVSNFRDVSERKENELQREKMTLDLVERNQNLEQYAFVVSHNLRAPVANILGIGHLLEMQDISEVDRQSALKHLFSSIRRLDEVIKDLNLVLQLRANLNEQKEDVDLEDLVDDIISNIPELVRNSRVKVLRDFNQVRSIATVKSYLYSIFYNLITNSIKYRQDGVEPWIRISSEDTGERLRLKFADNGLGIDLNTFGSKLFGLYQRFHPEQAEGKGLGLFMTKTQVEALGGKISVKSHVNIGTKFTIEL